MDEVRTKLAGLHEAIAEDEAAGVSAGMAVAAALAAGVDPGELRPLVERAATVDPSSFAPGTPWRAFTEARLAEAEGRPADAAEAFATAAVATFGHSHTDPTPAVLGTAHVGAARCLIVLGRLDEARAHADAAAKLLARWRGWRVDEMEAVQRRLGRGSEVDGPAALTPREREVAALLAEGLSNAELAERLYISRKTAAVHVSNILAKLGMASRAEVAAYAVREGLAVTA